MNPLPPCPLRASLLDSHAEQDILPEHSVSLTCSIWSDRWDAFATHSRPSTIHREVLTNQSCAPRNGKANLDFRYKHVVPKESVDWRTEGIVGPIKNQHVNGSKCGCCWSFATVGVVESINALATGHLDVLSEQQLIACDKKGEPEKLLLGATAFNQAGGVKEVGREGGLYAGSHCPATCEGIHVCLLKCGVCHSLMR